MSTDLPDPARAAEDALVRGAERVRAELCAQDEAWGTSGDTGRWTRRRFLAGAGMAGVAALGSQLVTSRVAYASGAAAKTTNTLIVVFLRGAADGLRLLVPASAALGVDHLQRVRGNLLPAGAIALPGTSGWALNAAARPLYDQLWRTGELAFVPAVNAPGATRSHFQAQQYLEHGGSNSLATGWLDRLLEKLGPGTTFRAVAQGSAEPSSLAGPQRALVVDSLKDFTFPGWDEIRASSQHAVSSLYRGVHGTLGRDVPATMAALATAKRARSGSGVRNGAAYPKNDFAKALQDLAAILRAEVGLQVATVDVGGWDTHTDEAWDFDRQLGDTATSLAAFMTDLGTARRKRVSVVVMTEFGRRVAMNASGGTDHGHGGVAWLLGGGIVGGVHGRWAKLSTATLPDGDVPGWNNPFDILGELAYKRLSAGGLSHVFPGHRVRALGVARS